jgi:hypothetical protein
MVVKVINVLHPFLGFAKTFFRDRVHNMVALMLDPCFKGMDCIMDYIGRDQATTLMYQYDDLIMMPMLKAIMGFFESRSNYKLQSSTTITTFDFMWIVWGIISTQEATESIFKTKLFLFCRFHVENVDFFDPLMWWATMSLGFQTWVFWHDRFWAS